MVLSSSAVLLMHSPLCSDVISFSFPLHSYLQRLTVFVVRFAVQTLCIDPTGFGRFGVSRSKEHKIGGNDITLIDANNIANANGTLRALLKTLLLLVQHFNGATVGDSISFVTTAIITNLT